MNRNDVLKIIGDDLRAEAAGQVRKSGPSMEQKLADAYGGTAADYTLVTDYNRFAAQTGRLWTEERFAWIDKILAEGAVTRKRGYRGSAKAFEKACELVAPSPPNCVPQSLRGAWAPANSERPGECDRKQREQVIADRIAELQSFIRDVDARLEAKKSREEELTPWEQSQREREKAESLFDVASHESRHTVVGLFYGAKIREVLATARSGHVLFDDLPKKGSLTMTIAGSLWEHRGLLEPSAHFDREQAEADIEKEIARRAPEANAREREYVRASILMDEEIVAAGIIEQRGVFYGALRDLLIERGQVSGREVHALWDEIYQDGVLTPAGERRCRQQYAQAVSRWRG